MTSRNYVLAFDTKFENNALGTYGAFEVAESIVRGLWLHVFSTPETSTQLHLVK